jgi:hypothetical protein
MPSDAAARRPAGNPPQMAALIVVNARSCALHVGKTIVALKNDPTSFAKPEGTIFMKKFFAIAAMLAASSFASTVQADDISLGVPGYGGTGCPDGSASVTLSEDMKSLSIIFDEYYVEAGGTTNKSFDRKSCNVAIPVHVPQGLSISVLAIDYRGANILPAGANSQFNVEYFFAGAKGPTFQKTFKGELDEEYLIQNKLTAQSLVWSKCGVDVNLRTNSSIRVTTKQNKQALATVDSQDVSAAIKYILQWKSC